MGSSDFWSERKVLITGATGFLGSWLTERLVAQGSDVTVFVKRDDPLDDDSIKHLSHKLRLFYGDIRDRESVINAVRDQEFVFHLAALTQVVYAIEHPEEAMSVNLGGTLNIVEGLRHNSSEGFLIFASTDKVYGEPQYLPINEEHNLFGKSPYDASKIAADRLVYTYHKTYGLPVSIVRCSNIYGGRDSNMLRAVPDFVTSIIKKKDLVIRGNGNHRRDYLFIDDAVDAYLVSAENREKSCGQVFNFGTGVATQVMDLANLVIKLSGKEGKTKIILANTPTPGEIDTQFLSFERARKVLSWRPSISLEDGLTRTIDWYGKNLWWLDIMERVGRFYGLG